MVSGQRTRWTCGSVQPISDRNKNQNQGKCMNTFDTQLTTTLTKQHINQRRDIGKSVRGYT